MRNLIFLISKAQRNFCNELFDAVKGQRNSAIVEWHFNAKSKRNWTSAFKISQAQPKHRIFVMLDRKEVSNLLKKADIHQYFDRNEIKLSFKYKIALSLLLEKKKKKLKAQRNNAQQIFKNLVRSAISVMFHNKKLKPNAIYVIVENGLMNCASSSLIKAMAEWNVNLLFCDTVYSKYIWIS